MGSLGKLLEQAWCSCGFGQEENSLMLIDFLLKSKSLQIYAGGVAHIQSFIYLGRNYLTQEALQVILGNASANSDLPLSLREFMPQVTIALSF